MSAVLLDTHAWLWWEADPDRLSAAAAQQIQQADSVLISSVSCWELAMLAEHRRLAFDRPISRWVQTALAHERVQEAPLTAEAAVEAALLPGNAFPGDPADRFIYATARLVGARLVTADQRLRRFDPTLTVW